MKTKLLVSLIAAAFLSGCASSGSNSDDAPRASNPIEVAPNNPIEKDDVADMPQQDHYSVNADGDLMVNGQVVGSVNELGEVRVDGVAVGRIYTDADGSRYFQAYGSDNKYYGDINKAGVITIDWVRTEIDGGWGNVLPSNPIEVTPANPIEAIPSNPIEDATPVNPIEVTPSNPIEMIPSNPIEVTPGNPIEGTPSLPIEDVSPEPMSNLSAEQKSQFRTNANELRAAIKARLNRS